MQAQIKQTSPISRLAALIFPWLLCAMGIYYFCLRILGSDLAFVPGDLTDSRFINYLLEHAHRWLLGKDSDFWDAGFMQPFHQNIALSDNMLGAAPLYSIWRLCGFDFESSFQLWWLCVCFLNFWSCYLVLRKFGLNAYASAMGAWLFAFSIFNLGQLSYMQLMVRYMVPPVFYACIKMISAPATRYLVLYALALFIQIISAMYTGIYLFYFSLLFLLLYTWLGKYRSNLLFYFQKKQLARTSLLMIFFGSLLFLALWPYQKMTTTVGLRLFKEVNPDLPTAKSFLFPHESSVVWRFLWEPMKPSQNDYWLQYVFPGMILFLCLLLPLYFLFRRTSWKDLPLTWRAVMLCAMILALLHVRSEGGLTLYALVFKLPGINSIRVPVRFMHVELFLLAASFAFLIRKLNLMWMPLVFMLVLADNLFDPHLVLRTPKAELAARRARIKNELDTRLNQQNNCFALIDQKANSFDLHLDAMIYAQARGIKTVNGYSSYCPDAYGVFFNANSREGLTQWLQANHLPEDSVAVIDLNR